MQINIQMQMPVFSDVRRGQNILNAAHSAEIKTAGSAGVYHSPD